MAVPVEKPQRRLRVLVVDDNIDQVRTMAFLVKDNGHHVDYAINGIVALDMAQRTKPDVVILDIGLPDTSGFYVAKQIRQSAGQNTRIIGITGMDINRQEAIAKGFDELLAKPVSFAEIEAALARVAGEFK